MLIVISCVGKVYAVLTLKEEISMANPVTPPRGQPVVQVAPGAPIREPRGPRNIDYSVNPARNLSEAFNNEAYVVQAVAAQIIGK